jgi:hypothetical protein
MLEKDLDLLLRDENPEATACQEDSGCSGPGDLAITSSPKGHIVHWKGMKLSNLLEAESMLVAHLEPLPFQEGRPLATTAEESTELVDESSHELSSRQVLMAEEGEDGGDLPINNFDVISEDEITANAGNENTPIVRSGGPGTGPVQSDGGELTSEGDLCIASSTPSLLL